MSDQSIENILEILDALGKNELLKKINEYNS